MEKEEKYHPKTKERKLRTLPSGVSNYVKGKDYLWTKKETLCEQVRLNNRQTYR
jgi:hypothetical protein